MKKITLFSLLILGLFLTGCATEYVAESDNEALSASNESGPIKIKNDAQLKALLESQGSDIRFKGLGGIALSARAESAPIAADGATGSNTDYSQTNNQYQTVDEADFVKNDAQYVYVLTNNIVTIIDSETDKVVSEIDLKNKKNTQTGRNLFIKDNTLVVLLDSYKEGFYFPKYDIRPQPTYNPETTVVTYDITDRANPELRETFTITGGFVQARLIDNLVYVVSQEYADYRIRPLIAYAEKSIPTDIYYFDNKEDNYNYNTVVSIDVSKDEVVDQETFLLGYASTIMVSENNIYISYQKQSGIWCFRWPCYAEEEDNSKEFYDIVVPLLEGEIEKDVKNILDKNLDKDEEWKEISNALELFYAKLAEDKDLAEQYEEMFDDIDAAVSEYEADKQLEQGKTIIHRIAITDGQIEYGAEGDVPGQLLNQYSLDEYDGKLRVATTVNIWSNNLVQYNNVYVLDADMTIKGKLEKIAKNESIYATRFVGDKLYLVTFRQVDPFFVIDLSGDDPEVLGYLKIPGYSSYLHPYKEHFIIGVGKEVETSDDRTITKGVKLSLFDVSDFEHPKEIDKIEIGMEGSETPVLYDPKAFLLSETKNIVVLPVSEVTSRTKTNEWYYRTKTWNGAYVFTISEDGFEEFGKVKHSSQESNYYDWWNYANVQRSLYIGDTIYTISNKYVKANDLANDLKELAEIELPSEPSPIMYADKGVAEPAVVADSVPASQ